MKTEEQILEELRRLVSESNQRKVAATLGVAPQFLNDILKGHRHISESFARAMGYQRSYIFTPVDKDRLS